MEKAEDNNFSRRFILGAFAASTITAAPTFTKAAGFLKGAGNIRSLNMVSRRTGERFKGIYCIDNKYISEVLGFEQIWHGRIGKNIHRREGKVLVRLHPTHE